MKPIILLFIYSFFLHPGWCQTTTLDFNLNGNVKHLKERSKKNGKVKVTAELFFSSDNKIVKSENSQEDVCNYVSVFEDGYVMAKECKFCDKKFTFEYDSSRNLTIEKRNDGGLITFKLFDLKRNNSYFIKSEISLLADPFNWTVSKQIKGDKLVRYRIPDTLFNQQNIIESIGRFTPTKTDTIKLTKNTSVYTSRKYKTTQIRDEIVPASKTMIHNDTNCFTKTTFEYDPYGNTTVVKTSYNENQKTTYYYTITYDYKFDEHKNWIERTTYFKDAIKSKHEIIKTTRKITYY